MGPTSVLLEVTQTYDTACLDPASDLLRVCVILNL